MRNDTMTHEIENANWQELANMERPTAEQRRRDLEESLGSFEDCLIDFFSR